MPEKLNTAPKFEAVLAAEARPQNRSVVLVVATGAEEKFALEFDARIVPATITALAGLLGQVVSDLPEDEQPNFQVLKTTGMGLAMNAQGELALALTLEGGGELALALAKGDLAVLRDEIEEAMRLAGDVRH